MRDGAVHYPRAVAICVMALHRRRSTLNWMQPTTFVRRLEHLVLALTSTFAVGCELEHSCTDIGCRDVLSVRIHTEDGMPRTFAVELQLDEQTVTCRAPTLDDSGETCDNPDVSVTLREGADCHEVRSADAISEVCTPNGKFEQVVTIYRTPKRAELTLTATNGETLEKAFEPHYATSQPNGPDCEPICHSADEEWLVPAATSELD